MSDTGEITDIHGNKKVIECLGCAIANGLADSPGGLIAETAYFNAQQDYEIPIPGFVILASKRHLQSVDEFTKEEQADFIDLLINLRKGIRKALSINTIYLVQEEDSSHFHIWLFPRYDWMEEFGKKIESVRPIMEYARENLKTKENLEEVSKTTKRLRNHLEILTVNLE